MCTAVNNGRKLDKTHWSSGIKTWCNSKMQMFLKQDVQSDVCKGHEKLHQMLRNPNLYLELNHQTGQQNQDSHKLRLCDKSKQNLIYFWTLINTIAHVYEMINLQKNILAYETMKENLSVSQHTAWTNRSMHVLAVNNRLNLWKIITATVDKMLD